MNALSITTIDGLCDAVALHCATCGNAPDDSLRYEDRKAVTDVITKETVRYLDAHHIEDDADYDKMQRRVAKRVRKQSVLVKTPTQSGLCGFVPILVLIGEAIFTWLIEKALSWLWDSWWQNTPQAGMRVASMATGIGGWSSLDDD